MWQSLKLNIKLLDSTSFQTQVKNAFLILINKLNPDGLDIHYVPCKCSVYWMLCIYLVFVVVAFFLKHQFTINEYFYLLPLLISKVASVLCISLLLQLSKHIMTDPWSADFDDLWVFSLAMQNKQALSLCLLTS